MKADGLAKLYDQLTLEERFRLRIRALARGDKADCERLDRACSDREYRRYCDRVETSGELVLCTMIELLPKPAKLRMLDALGPLVGYLEAAARDAAIGGYLDGLEAGWRAAGGRGDLREVADAELDAAAERAYSAGTYFSDVLDRLAADLAGSARVPRDGLAAFAEAELGLSFEDLTAAWARPAVGEIAVHREALDAAEAEAEDLALLGDVLRLAWGRGGLNDPTAELDEELRARMEAAEARAREVGEYGPAAGSP